MFFDILFTIVQTLIFPGLLFCCLVGLILAGIDRKIVARMQLRIGPPILQPCYDFFKLLGKETIVPRAAARRAFLAAPYIGLISLVITALFIPIFTFTAKSGVADLIVILYLLTIPTVAVIMGGASSGSQYAGVGVSREVVTVIAYELPLVMVLLAVGWKAGLWKASLEAATGGITFSLADIMTFQAASGMTISHWSMIPAALAMLLVIPAEVGSHPFDVAEAETEICEGPLVEYSGAPLAVFKLNHAIKMYIMTALFAALFLGGRGTGILALDVVLLFVICALLTIICMSLIHAVTARLKVEILFRFYWKIVTGLAGLSLVLVWLGI